MRHPWAWWRRGSIPHECVEQKQFPRERLQRGQEAFRTSAWSRRRRSTAMIQHSAEAFRTSAWSRRLRPRYRRPRCQKHSARVRGAEDPGPYARYLWEGKHSARVRGAEEVGGIVRALEGREAFRTSAWSRRPRASSASASSNGSIPHECVEQKAARLTSRPWLARSIPHECVEQKVQRDKSRQPVERKHSARVRGAEDWLFWPSSWPLPEAFRTSAWSRRHRSPRRTTSL